MQELPKPVENPVKSPKDPTAASRTWAIALVASAVLLLAAGGIVVWLVLVRIPGGVTLPFVPVDPSINVKNVTFVLPADMPTTYVKNDQSKVSESVIFYDDEATMCSMMLATLPADSVKKPQDIALERIAASYTLGMSVNRITGAELVIIRDGTNDYAFEAVATEVGVNVTGIGYAGRQQTVLFKKFGNQVAVISYGCKTETWAEKQTELATIVAGITVKTER